MTSTNNNKKMNNTNKDIVKRLTVKETELIEMLREASTPPKQDIKVVEKLVKQPSEGDLYFVLPDVHYPFQNEPLMEKIRQCIVDNPPKGVVIAGDWLDLFTLGSYNANSLGLLKDLTLTEEYEAGLKGIEQLESVLPQECKRMYLFGNHEDRYFREINKGDIAKYGGELIDPATAMKLKEYGYEVKTNWKDDFFTVGDLDIIHGMYTNIHVAKKHLDMHGRSIMFGHSHRAQTHYTGTEASFNIGCLCDINNKAFGYMPRMQKEQWTNGFGIINVIDGKSYVETIIVRSGSFYFNGKKY